MYKKCISLIFSELFKLNRLHIIKNTNILLNKNKIRYLFNSLCNNNFLNYLIITDFLDMDLKLCCKNIYKIHIIQIREINPMILLKYKNIVITTNAFYYIKNICND